MDFTLYLPSYSMAMMSWRARIFSPAKSVISCLFHQYVKSITPRFILTLLSLLLD